MRLRCCVIWPIRCPTCAPRRCCDPHCPLSATAISVLGPRLAQAILDSDEPAGASVSTRRMPACSACFEPRRAGWRVSTGNAADLLDAILHETAYPIEMHGPRERQARENLKKLRAMIRRAQNRGYATLARISEHSNSSRSATNRTLPSTRSSGQPDDCSCRKRPRVSIVFVVNMGRGTGGFRPAIRVADDVGAAGGQATVSIADYQSEADEDASAREKEESKRLLYVALTRGSRSAVSLGHGSGW